MTVLFDNGGDKISKAYQKGYAVGKLEVDKIWVTDLTGMCGTEHTEFKDINEVLEYLISKGDKYSPIFSESGIEVAFYSGNDPIDDGTKMVVVKKYQCKEGKAEEIIPAKSVRLSDFMTDWNKYSNTGIPTEPTSQWFDDKNKDIGGVHTRGIK